MPDLDNVTPFNGCLIKIIGMCVLDINPTPSSATENYQATLGIPIVKGHTPSITINQYDLNTQSWKENPPSLTLSQIASLIEMLNSQPVGSGVKVDTSDGSSTDDSSSRLLSFSSYVPNLSNLYKVYKKTKNIKIDWTQISQKISFSIPDGIFNCYQLETTNGTTLAQVDFKIEATQIQHYDKIAESIGFKLAFQSNQELCFQDTSNSSLLSLKETDNLYTVIEINNLPTSLPSNFEHFIFFYTDKIVTNSKDDEIFADKRILPIRINQSATTPVYCSPLITSTNGG